MYSIVLNLRECEESQVGEKQGVCYSSLTPSVTNPKPIWWWGELTCLLKSGGRKAGGVLRQQLIHSAKRKKEKQRKKQKKTEKQKKKKQVGEKQGVCYSSSSSILHRQALPHQFSVSRCQKFLALGSDQFLTWIKFWLWVWEKHCTAGTKLFW